jgi:two-component system nitrogen regulation sensor histidine kinase NtrY
MTSADTAAVELDDPSLAQPKGRSVRRWFGAVAIGLALFSAFLTFVVLTGLTPIEPKRNVVYGFLLINAATILVLVGIIVREVWKVVQARRRGSAAARLHIQVVSLFSVIAVLPAVLVAIVANVTIDRGLGRLDVEKMTVVTVQA